MTRTLTALLALTLSACGGDRDGSAPAHPATHAAASSPGPARKAPDAHPAPPSFDATLWLALPDPELRVSVDPLGRIRMQPPHPQLERTLRRWCSPRALVTPLGAFRALLRPRRVVRAGDQLRVDIATRVHGPRAPFVPLRSARDDARPFATVGDAGGPQLTLSCGFMNQALLAVWSAGLLHTSLPRTGSRSLLQVAPHTPPVVEPKVLVLTDLELTDPATDLSGQVRVRIPCRLRAGALRLDATQAAVEAASPEVARAVRVEVLPLLATALGAVPLPSPPGEEAAR